MILAALTALNVSCGDNWIEQVSTKTDPEAIQWVRQQLKEDLHLLKLKRTEQESSQQNPKKCLTTVDPTSDTEIPLYVLISFSVPDETWVTLSKEMEKIGAVFALRGLPHNSFKELSKKIQHLNLLGVKAAIQINPELFTTYEIDRVPSFLVINDGGYSKVSGNISLAYAIEKLGGIKK